MRGAAVAVALLGAACSTVRAPYSQIDHARARIPDMPGVRVWADDPDQPMLRLNTTAPLTMLTLSGGGAEGAYGAGFLSGWTDSGRRPRFTIVTGTSVGALMAPFAFLGPDYDPALKQIYVEGQMENLLRVDGINGLIGSSVFKAEPLKRLIDHYADQALIDAVAAERRKGRFLFVVTTNVDAQRAVVWDLTAVAASPSPNRYTLFRSILMASCAMPGIFPPSLIEVEADGRRFAEMHVDGSVTSNVLAVPEALLLSVLPKVGPTPPRLYVIVNGKLEPDFDVVADHTLSIVARSFWTTVKANTRNTLIATYEFTRRNGWEFRATAIERDHPIATASFNFEPAYMRGLYDYGYERGRSGRGWQAALPRASITARN
ncbi:patatin-like phospholipase family protein [Rhodoplanes roseus]|nr:patatin-like phospholipase family protein [Rhodoplanes roseus]